MKDFLPAFQNLETPFYFYDQNLLRETIKAIKHAKRPNTHLHFALKANNNPRILAEIQQAGFGADCVSGNEVKIALESDFSKDHIVLAGVGKTDKEINLAIKEEIFSLNVESFEELTVINGLAAQQGRVAQIAIRLNPEVDAGTHHYITTGRKENKFGLSYNELLLMLDQIQAMEHIRFIGLHFHIGSQIVDLNRFIHLCERINEMQIALKDKGIALPHLNVGGGLGIDYENPGENAIPDFDSYFSVFQKHLQLLPNQQLHYELGRSVVGQCGSLISKVLYTKSDGETNFIILDAGMTELLRPALYQSNHHIDQLSSQSDNTEKYHVVGPICESSDTFGKGLQLPLTKRGDLIAIRSAGAYGETMRSHYNARDYAQAVYSDDLVG